MQRLISNGLPSLLRLIRPQAANGLVKYLTGTPVVQLFWKIFQTVSIQFDFIFLIVIELDLKSTFKNFRFNSSLILISVLEIIVKRSTV